MHEAKIDRIERKNRWFKIIVEDFNIPLSINGRKTREIIKEIEYLNNTINQSRANR